MSIQRNSVESTTIDMLRYLMAFLVVMMHAAIGMSISQHAGESLLLSGSQNFCEMGGGDSICDNM